MLLRAKMFQFTGNFNIKCNKMWGPEYILMDSRKFLGGSFSHEYDNVIDMLIKIWSLNNVQHGANVSYQNPPPLIV